MGNTTQLNGSLSKAQTSIASFGGATGTVMAAAGAAIVGLGAVSVKAASDLTESLNKAKVVFAGSSDEVIAFSENTAESMGIAQAAALDAAAGFGAMAQSAGLSEKASADLSIDLVQLAADMASFNNQDPSEMLERLRSGLAGEAEPLRRFGVFISEARVQTEAYASGIARAGEELTDAQKVQARFNIIMQDTAKQQGDFQRTIGESLPNQLRVLKATLIDAAAALGTVLLPAVMKAVEAINFLLTPILEVVDALEMLSTFEPPTEQIQAATSWAAAARDLSEAWRAGEISSAAYEEGLRQISARFEGDQPVLIQQVEHYLALRDSWDQDAEAARGLVGPTRELGNIMGDATNAILDANGATRELTEAQRENRLATLAATNSFLAITIAADELEDAQRRVNKMQREGKTDTNAYEDAVLDALTAQIGLEEAVFNYAKELADSGTKQKDINDKIRDMARELGISKGAVDDLIGRLKTYIDELNRVPDRVHTQISLGVTTPSEIRVPIEFPRAQAGGFVERTGLAVIHKGENIVPAGSSGGISGDIVLNVDGRELARITRNELNRLAGRNAGSGLR